jgi:hypothetical protein
MAEAMTGSILLRWVIAVMIVSGQEVMVVI